MKPQQERWSRYNSAALAAGLAHHAYNSWLSHSAALGYMLRFQPPPARVISIGCGQAMFDILLASYGYDVTSVDSDPDVLRGVEDSMRRFDVKLDLHQADAFDLKEFHDRFDVAHSSGLAEHWHGTRTVELIKEHARCAPRVQIEVPSKYTLLLESIPEVLQDMHLYTPREFVGKFHDAGLRVEKVYSIGSVPRRSREVMENLIPPVIFRRIQSLFGYSMGTGCMAVRQKAS